MPIPELRRWANLWASRGLAVCAFLVRGAEGAEGGILSGGTHAIFPPGEPVSKFRF